jgi:2-haloacid dehalogenase
MPDERAPDLFVFDAFGTLFDTAALVGPLTARFGTDGPAIASSWRSTQLQTTWLRSLMGAYLPFDRITRDALDHAIRSAGHRVDDDDLDALADLYAGLPLFVEARSVIDALVERDATLAVLSNGSPAMLRRLVDGAGLERHFAALLSVDEVAVYKPHPLVYGLVTDRFGVPPSAVRFVSGNTWDCAGAARFGFEVTWIDRRGDATGELGWQPVTSGPDLRVLLGGDA